jgi:F-type H+-transporting ATPase subunit delta
MYKAERWADAFAAVAGDSLDEGLEVLNVISGCTIVLPGPVSGTVEALQLERMIRGALKQVGDFSRGAELAVRLAVLLVKKGRFFLLRRIIEEAEKIADARKGILSVVIESVTAPDKEFEEELKRKLLKQHGVWNHPVPKEIKLVFRPVPELLGGYRLRIGSELIDASLRGQIQNMAADLNTAGFPA